MLDFYYGSGSPYAWRVWLALEHKQVPHALKLMAFSAGDLKTPEYLAAGRPVVSTAIRDVVRPYGEQGLARIAGSAEELVAAVEAALGEDRAALCAAADRFLAKTSWDQTFARMRQVIGEALRRPRRPSADAGAQQPAAR